MNISILKLFDVIDNSGQITEDELFQVMTKFRKVSKNDVKKMIDSVDKNHDGTINISGKQQ
jgi:Ca2+-binding EF-hand superfamily protein